MEIKDSNRTIVELEGRVRDLEAENERLREALGRAADDLGKAANQFASMRESQRVGHTPPIQRNPERFAEKEARARAALQ